MDPAEIGARYPAQLSGGQRQRVGVARALAADPPLMLMDEPFGAIDPINRVRLQDEFLRLQERVRKTVVFVTHDIDEAIKMGDRIAILRQGGKLAQYDTPERILTAPADEFVAEFVGADRALKRLGLATLAEIELLDAQRPPRRRPPDAGDDGPRRALDGARGRRRTADGPGWRRPAGRRGDASSSSAACSVTATARCRHRTRHRNDELRPRGRRPGHPELRRGEQATSPASGPTACSARTGCRRTGAPCCGRRCASTSCSR